MPGNPPFNILVVDDHALVREAFTSMLRTEFPQATVVSAAGSHQSAAVGIHRQRSRIER
jgi:DNA-binding NarL/FixJ family response regulator